MYVFGSLLFIIKNVPFNIAIERSVVHDDDIYATNGRARITWAVGIARDVLFFGLRAQASNIVEFQSV
jgi:hypothetical protein